MDSSCRQLGILVDNGSLLSYAPLLTRKVAAAAQLKVGYPVIAASWAHSDRIPLEKLNGIPVPLFEDVLEALSRDCAKLETLTIVPFLLVTGGAIYGRIEQVLQSWTTRLPGVNAVLTDALIGEQDPAEASIAGMIEKQIRDTLCQTGLHQPPVILVDHGSPVPASGRVRDLTAAWLGSRLTGEVATVLPASMERRPEQEYDFNEPTLERALSELGEKGVPDVLLARLFLQPGKHSGKRGDVDGIVSRVQRRYPNLQVHACSRVFSLTQLTGIVTRRLESANT